MPERKMDRRNRMLDFRFTIGWFHAIHPIGSDIARGTGAVAAAQGEKFNSIQILRGLAALMVVVFHTWGYSLAPDEPNILHPFGGLGVQTFFVLSGFIMAYINPRGFSPGDFMWRRICRVVPLYWICTLFIALCVAFAPRLFKTTVITPDYLLRSLAFLPAHVPGISDNWMPVLKPGWSLNYEAFFYVLFALFWWCQNGLRRTVMMSGILGVFILGAFFVEPNSGVAAFYFNFNLMPFLVGMWLAELQRKGVWAKASARSIWAFACFAALGIATLFSVTFATKPLFVDYLAYSVSAALLVVVALCLEQRWFQGLSPRNIFVRMGDSSYSLYLTHMFVVGVGWAVFKRLSLGGWTFPLAMVAIVLGCILVAEVSYRVIEKPFTRLGHRLAKKRRLSVEPV